MLKVHNKDFRAMPRALFWCLYCWLWTYFTSCSSVSIVNFEHTVTSWEAIEWWSKFDKYFAVIIRTKNPLKNCSYMNEQIPQKEGDSKEFIVILYKQSFVSKVKRTLV